ncbi:MAG: hypothetical protein ABI693_12015, partial [Bryobacteraceae bacterium]
VSYNGGVPCLRFPLSLLGIALILPTPAAARQDQAICGTHSVTWREQLYRHQQSIRALGAARSRQALSISPGAQQDVGNIATMDNSNGVVSEANSFDLDNKTLTFQPSALNTASYRLSLSGAAYNSSDATQGAPVAGLGDDDARLTALPFSFPFFGNTYTSVYINSDGNLSFGESDTDSSARSAGRLVAGPPRIAPLFADLDPSRTNGGVRVLATPDRVVISWVGVPEYSDAGIGSPHTFQVRLVADGHIEFAWSTIQPIDSAVVGISPGHLLGSSQFVDLSAPPAGEYSAAVVESFQTSTSIDLVRVAQRFYETHEDAYDYLVVYNALGVAAAPGAVAFESTVRNERTGYGDVPVDIGTLYGSPRRLQSVINMGNVDQYSADIRGTVDGRTTTGDTPLSVIAHEMGHLFLAYVSVLDPNNPSALPMLNPNNNAHWGFNFNSEASLLEGNRIQDNGPNAIPRFLTIATVQGYAPLDQYLMGFRTPQEVPPTFLITNANHSNSALPRTGIAINGTRQDITVDQLIAVAGRRTPDSTVSQRHFRVAIILITGTGPVPDSVSQIEIYRANFESYYATAAGNRATMDTTLSQALTLSLFPAGGVIAGATSNPAVSVARPATNPITVTFSTDNGAAQPPASVTIPAGATKATFPLQGIRTGVSEITARIDGSYETASAKVQVLPAPDDLRAFAVSGDFQIATAGQPLPQSIVLRASDANLAGYAGRNLTVTASAGATVTPTSAVTDEFGQATFQFTPGPNTLNELYALVEGSSQPFLVVTALGPPAIFDNGVVNAASFQAGLVPNGLATIFGANLADGIKGSVALTDAVAGIQVTVNGTPAPLFYFSDRQLNFWVPQNLATGTADVIVTTPLGVSPVQHVAVLTAQPGIFYDTATRYGAILVAGTPKTTLQQPVGPGDFLEVYATGLGPVTTSGSLATTTVTPTVTIAGIPASVPFSGLAPSFFGLYQVNVQIPAGVPSGDAVLSLSMPGKTSNDVKIRIR